MDSEFECSEFEPRLYMVHGSSPHTWCGSGHLIQSKKSGIQIIYMNNGTFVCLTYGSGGNTKVPVLASSLALIQTW